jgi:hypothetical protein
MSLLLGLAAQAALPMLKGILARKLGDSGGRLAGEVVDAIAAKAGVADAAALDELAMKTPGRVIEAMRAVEQDVPEKLNLLLKETEGRIALLQAEQTEGGWRSAWRPAGMYVIGFLWLWNAVVLHVANAVWKIALPPMPFNELVQVTGLYMGLYMGGHTVKDLAEKWRAKA